MDWRIRQNPDGGWAYSRGRSWTEPTVFVLLAQFADGCRDFRSSAGFLRTVEGADGGFRPQASVQESTWVTALAALLPEGALDEGRRHAALEWLKGQTGRESGWKWKLRQRLAGNKEEFPEGWPWFPGAAAWVIPTSLGILAFERALRRRDDAGFSERVESGRKYLLSHMCADGGWNHGANRALDIEGESYPETTGIALFALHGATKSPEIEHAKEAARVHLRTCRSAEGVAWLRMALSVHGEKPPEGWVPPCRTTMDLALTGIASSERNPLLV